MRHVRQGRWVVCLWVVGLTGAIPIAPADAQAPSKVADARKVRIRSQLHPYHRSYENAKKADMAFKNPEEVVLGSATGKDQLDLTIGRNRFLNRNADDVTPPGLALPAGSPPGTPDPMPHTFELLSYNGRKVGPTLRVQPGATFRIRVRNSVHGDLDPGDDPDTSGVAPTAENVHGLCTTNLHTHGLHVSPSGNSDNVFRQIEPGEEFTFEYKVPKDHPAGTFWYHPHKHGSAGYQLSNGLSGALIVEGTRPDDLDQDPQVAATKDAEKVLVLQSYTFATFNDPLVGTLIGFIDGQGIYNVNGKGLTTCDAIRPDANSLKRSQGNPWTALAINGTLNPKFELQPGEVQRWRVVHGGWDAPRNFAFYTCDGTGPPVPTADVQVYEIALDGITTGLLDKQILVDPKTAKPTSKWTIAPGQRSDVLIQATPPAGSKETTYYLMIPPDPGDPTNPPPVHVAKLVVKATGAAAATKLPDPANLKKYVPKSLQIQPTDPLASATIPTAGDAKQIIANAQGSGQPGPRQFTSTLSLYSNDFTHTYTLNGLSFHSLAQDPIPLKLGTVQAWTLRVDENSDSGHPFHLHVNPFQVISGTDANGDPVPMNPNTWRDTLYVDIGYSYAIRAKFKDDIGGLAVLHCHILDHEDQGMMWPILLSNADAPTTGTASRPAPATPGGAVAPSLKPVTMLAPAIRLPDAAGKPRDLAEFRGREIALVFFRGVQCFHCAEQLRDLVRDARAGLGPDVEVVAVSSGRIKDPAKALAALGVKDSDRFHLLVDETSRAFRDYGCLAAEPQHGLFLIDQDGTIRWSYVGETPFADTRLVVDRLRELAAPPQARSQGSQSGVSASRDASRE